MDGGVEDKIDCIDIGNHRAEEPGSYASNGSYASYVSPMVADDNKVISIFIGRHRPIAPITLITPITLMHGSQWRPSHCPRFPA